VFVNYIYSTQPNDMNCKLYNLLRAVQMVVTADIKLKAEPNVIVLILLFWFKQCLRRSRVAL